MFVCVKQDYLVLLPSAYYEAPILQMRVTEPCTYGSAPDVSDKYVLSANHHEATGRIIKCCGNTAVHYAVHSFPNMGIQYANMTLTSQCALCCPAVCSTGSSPSTPFPPCRPATPAAFTITTCHAPARWNG